MKQPKVVKLSLPQNKFKQPLSQLKKTFSPGTNVLQEISKYSEERHKEVSQRR